MPRKIFTFKNKRTMPKWLAYVLAFFLKVYSWTFRVKVIDKSGAQKRTCDGKGVVFALWHNRILFSAVLMPKEVLKNSVVLISASRDGEYISTLVKCFGLSSIRGSSSRGGAQALLNLEKALSEGVSTALTVDGPRGPRYTVHSGAVVLSRKIGAPIVPVAINSRHFWQMKSWDKLQVPWPFTSIEVVFGDMLYVSEEETNEEANERLRNALLEITKDN